MTDALVSIPLEIALEKLAKCLGQQIRQFAGVTRELERIRNTFQSIKAYLRDAESKQVADRRVRLWLSKLKAIAQDIEDVLDESQISDDNDDEDKARTCFPSPYACFNRSASRYKLAHQIKEIREKLDQIAEDQKLLNFSISSGEATPVSSGRQTGALVEESEIIGRDEDKETVISRLVSGSSSGDGYGQQVHLTAIVGLGGLGKTTLAQQIYNDVKVQDHFDKALYWVCVSEVFDVIRLTKAILDQVKGENASHSELHSLQKELLESLRGKRFLLVLDDVWNEEAEKWEPLRLSLKSGAQGSRIVVTTRSQRVANIMNAAYVHKLDGLSDDLSWTLFSSRAFAGWEAGEHSELETVGREIVRMCKGIPLSIKVMGSAMNSKRTREDWQNILHSKMWSLPQVTDKIFPALMLSYQNLPPYLKQCFAYCSIFRKDTEMEKNELVMLWVTQGFIQPQGNRKMEDIGEEYFNDLVARSMFQEVRRNIWGKTACKMHDLLHDLAEFLMKDESYIFPTENSNQCSIDVRHASLFPSEDNPSIPISSCRANKLRTLFVHGFHETDTILVDMFRQARFLRALISRRCKIKMLPKTIGKLKHLRYVELSSSGMVALPNVFEEMKQLRYLDLSRSNIVELPESMSHLVNLHTLNLNWCQQLKKLPRNIGEMVSLRHLEIEWTWRLECLPNGLGRIICLQSLSKFMVGGEGGCGIDELQPLNSLQGSLEIEHLERVSSPGEAEKAELWKKSHLRKLALRMSSGRDEEIALSGRNDAERERMENVLDGLRPHPNLEELELACHRSSSKLKLPRWMEESSFSKLTDLHIYGFSQCEENLLGLGKLPALKKLELYGVGVRKMGDEFYYGMSSNDAVGKRRGVSFPKLETLSLEGMPKLEEWELASEADDAPKVMPSLRQLKIIDCPELQVLPPHLAYAPLARLKIKGTKALSCVPDLLRQLESLERLTIEVGRELEWQPLSSGRLKRLQISGAAALSCLSQWGGQLGSLEKLTIKVGQQLEWPPHSLRQLRKLRYLEIKGAEALTCLPDSLGQLESLEGLVIDGCQKLVSLPHSLGQLQKLKSLEIRGAEALTCLPDWLGQLESLEDLAFHGCQKLESLPLSSGQLKSLEISGAEALSCLNHCVGQLGSLECLTIVVGQQLEWPPHSLRQLRQLQKLRYLDIRDAEALTCLPDSLGHLESLANLNIIRCQKLASLPHSLGQLKALKSLFIWDCKALESLPDALQDLPLLQELEIRMCPLLLERYKSDGGRDWPKISHIPEIGIYAI